MDEMDRRIIFKPLPDSKEAELKKSMPQLSSIVDKIDELHTRSYSSHVYSKKEERQLRIIIYYMELVSVPKNQTYEWALIHYILPKLSITPFHFEGNIFYVIQGLDEAQRTTLHPIFSEADIYSFFKSYYFSTLLPPPNEKQLTAILFWHHNKINNIAAYYQEASPLYSYQLQALRTLPYAFTWHYKAEQQRGNSPRHTSYVQIDFSKEYQTLYKLLKAPNPLLPYGFTPYKYVANLLSNLTTTFNGEIYKLGRAHALRSEKGKSNIRDYRHTLSILWALSNGNLSALSALHNMFATVYLGQRYVQEMVGSRKNISVLLCKDVNSVAEFIKLILDSSFMFSSKPTPIDVPSPFNQKRSIYTEYSVSDLCGKVKASKLLNDEVTGHIVNISIQKGKEDIEKLKTFALQRTLKHENDDIFKECAHCPCTHYIYITEDAPIESPNMEVIELMGDIADKSYELLNLDAAVIVLLSLFNFFTPTATPKNEDSLPDHLYKGEEAIVQKFIEDLFDDTTSKFTAGELEKAIKDWQLENEDADNFNSDISHSDNDESRKKVAEKIGISKLPYTIRDEIISAFAEWRQNLPVPIPNIDIIDVLKKLYNPLFYVKFKPAKSRITPDAPERNVKVFHGLALNVDKFHALVMTAGMPVHDDQQRQEEFFRYYDEMIQNFQKLQPQIIQALKALAPTDFDESD
ncbi:hypothetical protein [Selenomonas noxia]|uniref:hypothetical protein n=1 Tax=Selenomonas noxia TaxID=135083 RepID=UPI0028D1AB02|nr:hypothetical protein [Selenomonas noxia]